MRNERALTGEGEEGRLWGGVDEGEGFDVDADEGAALVDVAEGLPPVVEVDGLGVGDPSRDGVHPGPLPPAQGIPPDRPRLVDDQRGLLVLGH